MNELSTIDTFIYIVTNIIFPIFFLIAIGFIAQKKLKMDIRTLTRLNIYIFTPAVLFIKIYETKVSIKFFFQVLIYAGSIQCIMYFISWGISKVLKYDKGTRKAFCNSLIFFNSGNYGLPLIELVTKGNPVAVTSQVFIMLLQNITTNSIGVFQASSGKYDTKQSLKNILAMPAIYAMLIVAIVKILKIEVPALIMLPLDYISRGFIAMALVTLGAQLLEVKIELRLRDIFVSSFTRLILSPILGAIILIVMGVKGILAQALIFGISTPTAVTTALIAREFDNEPEYASQIVFVSTILSGITIPIIIYLTGQFLL